MLDQLKTAAGSSPVIAGMASGLLGLGVSVTEQARLGNSAMWFAGCAVAGALLANLPKLITARANARLSESEFLSRTNRSLIESLQMENREAGQIHALDVELRHKLAGGLQAAGFYIELLKDAVPEEQQLASFHMLDVVALHREYDQAVWAIKNRKREILHHAGNYSRD